ncbi:MAG: asparagine synthase (glutamine-hydrolyzing) [Flavobacteriales bacterium]
MCGISGIVQFKNTFNTAEAVRKMNELMAHRGPDDEGFTLFNNKTPHCFFSEVTPHNVRESSFTFSPHKNILSAENNFEMALAHRRLSILDLSPSGHQPMCSADQQLWITFNGEIYNYIELRDILQAKGHQFLSNSDTEVILAAYREWGTDCSTHFNGMWAFVIYDSAKEILFCSRDRVGVKPFYYFKDENKFLFASEQKAILHSQLIAKKINKQAAFDYLSFNETEHHSQGMIDGIVELPPAHQLILKIRTQEISIQQYYTLEVNREVATVNQNQLKKYNEEVLEKITNAVKLRLRADVEVGSCLSGGLDSSSIVGLMHHLLPQQKLHLYTSTNKEKDIDESKWAKAVVDYCKGTWHTVQPTSAELLKDLEELTYCQDIPLFSTSTYAQWRVMKQVKESGIKVVLDGQGGDELFAGYEHHRYFAKKDEHKAELSKEWMKRDGLKLVPIKVLKKLYRNKFQDFKMISADLYNNFSEQAFIDFKKDRQHGLNDRLSSEFYNSSLKSYLKCEDRCSMWFSVESRVPFADDSELIELLFSIPGAYKIQQNTLKYLLKENIKGFIPEEVRLRKDKLGYTTPNNQWIYEMKDDVRSYFNNDLSEFIDVKHLLKNYDTFFDQRHRAENRRIFKLISFAIWKKVNGL